MNLKSTKAETCKQLRGPSLIASSLCCILLFGLTHAHQANATQGQGVTAEPLAVGGLSAPIRLKMKPEDARGFGDGATVADVVAVRFTIEPGGYFGWHRHGGPVWVVVNQGTLTLYDPDEPTCTRTYGPGSAFLEVGDHVHNAVNEGDVDVVVVGTFLLPDGAPPRIDAPDPGVCSPL